MSATSVLNEQQAARSSRPDVRNPMLKHPKILEGWAKLPADSKAALVDFLRVVSRTAHDQGDALWKKHKYTSASYWKAKAVDARHLAISARHVSSPAMEGSIQTPLAISESGGIDAR